MKKDLDAKILVCMQENLFKLQLCFQMLVTYNLRHWGNLDESWITFLGFSSIGAEIGIST